jgi:hypothetical protein
MSNATQENGKNPSDTPAVPPNVGCPTWCHREHSAWTPDAEEFATDHGSRELASAGATYSVRLYAVDWFYNGTLEIRPACTVLRLEDELLQPEDATLLAGDLARVNALAADLRRVQATTEAGLR